MERRGGGCPGEGVYLRLGLDERALGECIGMYHVVWFMVKVRSADGVGSDPAPPLAVLTLSPGTP